MRTVIEALRMIIIVMIMADLLWMRISYSRKPKSEQLATAISYQINKIELLVVAILLIVGTR